MKRFSIFLSVLVLLCASCTKQGPAAFRGWYSFKTGGTLDISGKLYDLRRDTTAIDTTVNEYRIGGRTLRDTVYHYTIRTDTLGSRDTIMLRRLVAESGQMHILQDGPDGMVLTMNITGGDPVVFKAMTEGNILRLEDTRRMVPLRPDEDSDGVSFDLAVSGSGRRLENMLIFDLKYEGRYNYDGFDGEVKESRVNCIATENE